MTVADMPRIAKHHDLVPVPVDVEIDSMAPRVESLEKAATSACRVLVLTHLFGGRADFSASIGWARRRGMVIIEDCAEAYWDPTYLGDPRSDVSLFIFGAIKHRTGLGGAVVRITDTDLLQRVRRVIADHPTQKTSQYVGRLLKYGVLHKISARASYAGLVRMTRWFGVDHDRLVNDLTRGYGHSDFVHRVRHGLVWV
jgi:dTDP-4-amino-4,6-dideoxygalactose transaminase